MKRYESVSDGYLPSRMPIIVRLDGNSFHKFTNMYCERPFDEDFHRAMMKATEEVLSYCSGPIKGYTQSDEISILLRNDQSLETEPFLANRIQKMTSLLASKCSVAFNREFIKGSPLSSRIISYESFKDQIFDCRVFVLPESEVENYFRWRELDAFKNCVSICCYTWLANKVGKKTAMKMVDGKTTDERQEILWNELGLNVSKLPDWQKRGAYLTRNNYTVKLSETMQEEQYKNLLEKGIVLKDQEVMRSKWEVNSTLYVTGPKV